MSAILKPKPLPVHRPELVVYPDSDGKPMSENMKQRRWIRLIEGNVSILYGSDPNVLVTGDLLWYAVEGFPEIRAVPDAMVIFGRPKYDRGSYLQWLEDNVAPQVVFEILSPGNKFKEMELKRDWYEEHDVEEYYVFDPDENFLRVFLRQRAIFRPKPANGFISPRMKIRFDLSGSEMAIFYPDGRRFLDVIELDAIRAEADKRADAAEKRADDAEKRAVRIVELSRKVRRGEASAEELAELNRLESEVSPT